MRVALTVVGAVLVAASGLSPETLKSYERYVALTEERISAERAGTQPFLWIDRQSERERAKIMERLRRGEVVIAPLKTRDAGKSIDIKRGLVHHWVATVLLPGVRAEGVLELVRDYGAYPKVFTPLVTRAALVQRQDDRDVVAMRTSVKKVISVVMDGDYVMEYRRLAPGRAVTTNVATNLHQVSDDGKAGERREPADQTSGYLWRYRMYCSFDERPEGTLDQCESLTLTRGVPALVSWLVGPLVTGIPRDSLALMLSSARAALVK